MKPRHRVSRTAIDLIKRFEGYRRTAAQLPDGRWTIGHGHTLTARQGAVVSEDDAEALLIYDLIAVAHDLNERIFTPLTQNQFDALTSFAFNLGLDNFRRSAVLKRINEGALIEAACAMELWRKADFEGERIVIDALVRRRSAEKTLFLTPAGDAWVPAPSPILRPAIDTDSVGTVPRQSPTPVTTSMDGERVELLREGEPVPTPVEPQAEPQGPAAIAAESVTNRLKSIFADPGEEPQGVLPGFAPLDTPFDLPPRATTEPPDLADEPKDAQFGEEVLKGEDLFDYQTRDEDSAGETVSGEAHDVLDADWTVVPSRDRLPNEAPGGSAMGLVALAVIGLSFFAGGLYWATNARALSDTTTLDPRLVGWLAGLAGVGFFAVAVYGLLDRLSRAAERRGRHGPRDV